jgi:hypothetical protein
MSFFKKLKGLVGQAESALQKANTSINTLSPPPKSEESAPAKAEPKVEPSPAPVTPAFIETESEEEAVIRMGNTEPKVYFAEILSSEFSQYEVRENVPLSEFGGEGRAFDFALFEGGQIVAVVIMAKKNRVRNHHFWNSEKKAKELGVPFINFYTHMENEKDYVINRINRFMGRA